MCPPLITFVHLLPLPRWLARAAKASQFRPCISLPGVSQYKIGHRESRVSAPHQVSSDVASSTAQIHNFFVFGLLSVAVAVAAIAAGDTNQTGDQEDSSSKNDNKECPEGPWIRGTGC